MEFNKITGNIGEKLACKYLSEQKINIIKTNFRNKIGEIDIIAKEGETLLFIEVKTRGSAKFGLPREAINYKKINKIKNTAISYLKYSHLLDKVSIRFDCIEIIGDINDYQINYLKNIF